MKLTFSLSIICIAFSGYCQGTGALPTDPAIYARIGTAPLPMGADIPSVVDLSPAMPPVGNQYNQNSCVAWTVAYANYSFLNKATSTCNYLNQSGLNGDCTFSPSYIYNQINGGQNNGTSFYDAFRVMQNQGVAPLSAMPYINSDFLTQPSASAHSIANNYKIDTYWQLGATGTGIQTESIAYLSKGLPIIVSVKVDDYLRKQTDFPNPYVWEYRSGITHVMNHAILIVGYDNSLKRFKFINSYGTNWGNSGYGYISYDVFPQVVNEAFIIKTKTTTDAINNLLAKESKVLDQRDRNVGLDFRLEGVDHTLHQTMITLFQYQNDLLGFRGSFSIPSGFGRTAQIAIYFYYRNQDGSKGSMLISPVPQFRTLNGQTVVGTQPFSIVNGLSNAQFYARLPYSCLGVPGGFPQTIITTLLTAEPVLLIDGFPVRFAQRHDFYVSR